MINISKPSISEEDLAAVIEVLESGWLGMGPISRKFEETCAEIIGCKYFVGLSSGTKALEVALMATGCRAGDEVLVPSITYASVIQLIINLSLVPVFVDSNLNDINISIDDMLNKITDKTRFILPTHYRGRSCDMDVLNDIADQYNLKIIEDAAHAFGSKYQEKNVGQDSYLACFSFGPLKNVTCGSGGGIATNEESIAEFIKSYRNVGISRLTLQRFDEEEIKKKYPWDFEVIGPGDRCHLPEMNAALGLSQLDKLERFKEKRKQLVKKYDRSLSSINQITTLDTDLDHDFLYIYTVLVPEAKREDFMRSLIHHGIHTSIHFPASHQQPFFKKYANSELVIADEVSKRLVTLPLYNDLKGSEQDYVIEQVKNFFK